LTKNPDAEYIFNFQDRQTTKFIWLTGYPNHKGWRKKFFFAQGDWEFSLMEIIKDPSVPREIRLPSVIGQEELTLDQSEEARVGRLREYARENPSKMEFNVIFSLMVLATYLRYPQIDGLVDEVVPRESEVQLVRKRKRIVPKTSGSQLPKAKRLKLSAPPRSKLTFDVAGRMASEASQGVAFEPLRQPTLQLSLSKQTAFPRKSKYDKGKGKVGNNLPEGPTAVGPLSTVRATDRGEKPTILDLLIGTRPSRDVTVPFEEGGSSVTALLLDVSLPQISSAIISFEPRVVGETPKLEHNELKGVGPFVVEDTDGSGAFLPRLDSITAQATK
jgi:hypothetical protein